MLYRIPMDTIHMPAQIFIVSDQVLPKSALPDATFTPFRPAWGNPLTFVNSAREQPFDQTPTPGKIRTIRGQSPNAM